jgi:hypothetical protein
LDEQVGSADLKRFGPDHIFAAHARLMFRKVVLQADAIAAVICIESSMTTSAILDNVGNALHSTFAENPDQECTFLKYGPLPFILLTVPSLLKFFETLKYFRQIKS